MITYICSCGHPRTEHGFENDDFGTIILEQYGDSWCSSCCKNGVDPNAFHQFKLDNLSYLEQKAEAKGIL